MSIRLGLVAASIALLFSSEARAEDAPQATPPERHVDPLFPASGHLSMSFATGIPFLAMTEVAVGLGDRFAVGALAGIAMSGDGPPNNVGFGVRPRVAILKGESYRLEVVAPTLYYPKSNGTWYLTRPSAQVERTFENGASLYGGVGIVMVLTAGGPASLPYGGTPTDKNGQATNGIWNTLSAGGAIPVSKKTHLFGEASLVLDGYKLPGQEWVGGVPFTVTLGITTQL